MCILKFYIMNAQLNMLIKTGQSWEECYSWNISICNQIINNCNASFVEQTTLGVEQGNVTC